MLIGLKEILKRGRERNIAIGSFNTPNLECLCAVLAAAEELDTPVIVAHAQIHESVAPIEKIGRVMTELAKHSKVDVCVHLDHGESFEYCKKAIELGFTSVMIDQSNLTYEENICATRAVADFAHMHGVDVEAELGQLPSREGGGENTMKTLYTDPELVPDFIERTKSDALAIAFGTVHGIYNVKPLLNMDIVSAVRKRTNIPLVMHGGSGLSDTEYSKAIECGINKINYYTYMSYAGYAAAKELIDKQASGFFHNLALTAQNAMKENALRALKVFSKN
jgi:fructose-bisphosphate aldolase class II